MWQPDNPDHDVVRKYGKSGGTYPGVWNPTGGECARYWSKTYPAGTRLRLEASIWRNYPGSLS